jgi:hypothetical protein
MIASVGIPTSTSVRALVVDVLQPGVNAGLEPDDHVRHAILVHHFIQQSFHLVVLFEDLGKYNKDGVIHEKLLKSDPDWDFEDSSECSDEALELEH